MIWAALILCLIAAAVLAGIESALISVSRVRARHAADDGDKQAAKLAALLENRQQILRAAMAAHHFFTIAAIAIVIVVCHRVFHEWGILLAAVLGTPLLLVALELVPKALFRIFPFRSLRRLTPVLSLLQLASLPWRMFSRQTMPGQPTGPLLTHSTGVSTLTENIVSLKLLPENTATLLSRYAAFVNLRVADVAGPVRAAAAVTATTRIDAVLASARNTLRRHHLVQDDSGQVIGVLDAAALPPSSPQDHTARQFAIPVPHIAPDDSALTALKILRKSAMPFAVVDGTLDVVELEALMERLMNISGRSG